MPTGQEHTVSGILFPVLLATSTLSAAEHNGRMVTEFAVATQSSTFVKGSMLWSAEKALDGCYDETCTARTKGEEHNLIRLDLRNVYKISSVVIYAVTEESCPACPYNGITDVRVEMSKIQGSPQCVSTNVRTLNKERNITIQETDDGQSLPDSRYISLTRTNHPLIIAEIQVFGDCPNSYCGKNCSEFCFCKTPLTSEEKRNGQHCHDGCLEGWEGEMCNKPECSEESFGLSCHFECRCVSGCDPWTGECLGSDKRCFSGFSGSSCQKQDLKPVYLKNGSANDGNPNTCINKWTRQFSFASPIQPSFVEITYKSDQSSNQLYLQLQSSSYNVIPKQAPKGIGCGDKKQQLFQFNNINISKLTVFNIPGKLCEIQVFVCSPGTFGPDCSSLCHCLNRRPCNSIDGSCPDGKCEQYWAGKACDSRCSNGTFGKDCSNHCHCIHNQSCDYQTGKCPSKCSAGWTDTACDKPCSHGSFGTECQYPCGHCTGGRFCDHISGNCSGACEQGWQGPRCLQQVTDDRSKDEYIYEPVEDLDSSTTRSTIFNHTEQNCTDCDSQIQKSPEQGSDNMRIAYVVLGTSLLILILLTTIAVIYSIKKRKGSRLSKYVYSYVSKHKLVLEMEDDTERGPVGRGQSQVVEIQGEEFDGAEIDVEADVLDDAVLKIYDDDFVLDSDPNGPIPLAKLWSHIQMLREDDDMLLKKFASLPIGICDTIVDASIKENKKKNRYNGVFPYDFNRVKLQRNVQNASSDSLHVYDNVESDFINASYFDGFGKEKAYIVTQGPLDWTRGDFWEMIWQENTTQIVMLTNLIEGRKIKCCKYWPDEGKAHFGKVSIKHLCSTKLPDYTVTKLLIKVGEGTEPRIVSHFHYETWPDKGIPDSAWNLVEFWRQVRSRRQDTDGPLVVHCSAGVGRSGTFVGLDYLYDQAMSRRAVRVFDCVRFMRKQRINMVQTKLQYLYLHEILAEAAHCGSLPVDQQIFQEYVEDLNTVDNKKGKTNMQIQYEHLCEGIAFSLSEEEEQIYANNRSVHVQALYLKNHEGNDAYLVEQSCYLADDEEFWRNVYNTRSKTIVTFECLEAEISWLENEVPHQVGEIELTQTTEEARGTYIRRVLTVQTEAEEPHEVHLFEATFWKGERASFSHQDILCFMEEIEEWQKAQTDKEIITLQYGDYPSQIGVFLVIYDELERCHYNNKIGLFETVWKFKSVFPNIIPDFEQYQLCYTTVSERQKASATYYNM